MPGPAVRGWRWETGRLERALDPVPSDTRTSPVGWGLSSPLEQQIVKFEGNTVFLAPRALAGLPSLGPECGRFA